VGFQKSHVGGTVVDDSWDTKEKSEGSSTIGGGGGEQAEHGKEKQGAHCKKNRSLKKGFACEQGRERGWGVV